MRVYLDHNATTTVRPAVISAMTEALTLTGNPSSVHSEGRAKRGMIEAARRSIAVLVGADADCITFTSGGTEASNLALSPSIKDASDPRPVTRLIVSAIEHPAVMRGWRFSRSEIESVPVDSQGVVNLGAVEWFFARHREERPGERMMMALMLANNETGVIQPVAEATAIAKRYGGLVHVDAVQAAGKIPVDIAELGCDFIAISAHKFGGPAGVGALIRAHDALLVEDVVLRGGGQERGWRSGTENAPGIIGMGVAAEAAGRDLEAFARLAEQRDRLEAGVKALGPVTIFGAEAPRLPNTSCFADPRVSSSSAMIGLDLAGVSVSSGSACSSGKAKASPVLDAMGVTHDLSSGMLRASFGWSSGPNDAETFLAAWSDIVKRIVSQANAA
ncbi:cysteine desulfurase [Methylopila capsulata]|uniref:Cysteine desulfurase n=1 Tax=Methylopila capsulata TaxID=61654 RepID=A0A9W6MRI0_9HYPH|nr:cysteine desulfurase family protein [Methylopila capsulata]MBM7849996.1 cysteine desulfurase [Methylopila capsulata]GLK55288.1 cysteine desulfurase [Methylopila capsulata]